MPMLTRREFCKTVAGAAALSMMPPVATADDRPTALFDRQQAFDRLRFGLSVHFGLATFQDREWANPTGPVDAFDPDGLYTDQWAAAAVSAKMKYGCLTANHHDGFCLWPTKTAAASVAQTPRKVDVVKAFADSFRKAGLSVGLCYSMLDLRNNVRHLRITPEKRAMIGSQLTELLTDYGPIDLLMFDGWNAAWSRIDYDEIPFREIYDLVKKLQPSCLICESNNGPPSALFHTDVKAYDRTPPVDNDVPSQSRMTLTDGWFFKTGDDRKELKSAEHVIKQWLEPLNARHCNLLLNAPPDRHGRLTPNVVSRLAQIGKTWTPVDPTNPLTPAVVITTNNLAAGRPVRVVDGDFKPGWSLPAESKDGWLELDLPPGTTFDTVAFHEPIGTSRYPTSRIGSYKFEANDGDRWRTLTSGDGGRAVSIRRVDRTTAATVRLRFTAKAASPRVGEIGIYDERAG